jgi:hypothetical protein
MIDLTTYSQDEVIAKGQYSIVRAAHEDAKKRLALLCGQFASITPQVLRLAQPDNDAVPDGAAITELMTQARALLDKIEALAGEIEGLAMQRAALKNVAWGR